MALVRALLALPFLLCPLAAQWPTAPTTNLPIGDRTGSQATPKIAATADGGCYIGWFDNASGNYDVWLQRLDASGNELWPHNGVLVSNQPQQSSLVDWDLLADSSGGAVVTFCDVRNGADLDVYAYRFAPNGTPMWGNLGVTLSNNADFEAAPQVAETSDGEFVFAWSRSATGGSIEFQRLTPAGVPHYQPDPMSIPGASGTRPGFVHVAATGSAGEFALVWVSDTSFLGNRHVHAQKFDALGQPLWGASPVSVFDAASVPIAHQPRIVSDGNGGAWIAWHWSQGSLFTTRAQRIGANGAEVFAHDGIDVSTEPNVSKLDPYIALDAASGDLLCAFNVRSSAQDQWGVGVQRISGAGALLWTAAGTRVATYDSVNELGIRLVPSAGGAIVTWLEQPAATPQQTIRASRVNAAGAVAWPGAPRTVASTLSEKLHPAVDVSPSGVALLTWSDRRADGGDTYAQNVNGDGSLGPKLADANVYGSGINPAVSMAVTGVPRLGTNFQLLVHNPAGTQAVGSVPFVVFSFGPDAAYPAGTAIPGFGMSAAGASGELLIDPALLIGSFQAPVWNGAPSALGVPVPLAPILAGAVLYAQGLVVDPTVGAAVPHALTDAARLTIGF